VLHHASTFRLTFSANGSSVVGHRRTIFFLLAAVGWLLGFSAPAVKAQEDPLQSIGILPFSAQLPVESGYITPATGGLHLEIPLGTFPQRSGPPVKFTLMYDSTIWTTSGVAGWTASILPTKQWGNSTLNTAFSGGWRLVSSADPGWTSFATVTEGSCSKEDGAPEWAIFQDFVWTSPDGTTHSFPGVQTEQGFNTLCGNYTNMNQPTSGGPANDASGFHIYITNFRTVNVFGPDGTQVYSGTNTLGNPEDSNGNYFTQDSNQNLIDTLGRTPVTASVNGNTITLGVLNSTGARSNYTIALESVNVYTDFAASGSGHADNQGTLTEFQSIGLPDGTSYSFGYDSGTTQGHYGLLTSMTLPTGGQITYSYANFDDSEADVLGKHVTRAISARATPDGTWTYTPSVLVQCYTNTEITCQQQMTVADPSGNNAVYAFAIAFGAWPIEAQYYNGAVSSPNLLATISQIFGSSTCVNVVSNCQNPVNIRKTATTTSLPLPGGTTLNQTTEYSWDTTNYGNLIQESEWNFYTGSLPTTADRTTTYAYLNGFSQNNIVDRPTNITVTSKSGSTVSETVNSYDGSVLSTATGLTHHDDTNYGSSLTFRGNLTQIQKLISGTSTYLTTSKLYDTTGNITSSTDSNNNSTTYSYADNFFTDAGDGSTPAAFSAPAPTNAYVTTVTQGSLMSTLGYYWGKGQKALATDPNHQTMYSHFYDLLDRPTSTKLPDGGWTFSVYPSGSETQVDTGTGITSTTLTTNCPSNANACRHDQILRDSLARTTSKILISDPIGQITTATVYDSDGRVQKVSNPYRTTTDSTYGWTVPGYDGLNRTIQVQEADGSVTKTYYGANVTTPGGLSSQLCSSSYGLGYPVLALDEEGHKRQSWTDGFGRLIEVDEPNSAGTLSVGTCYSYDLNNNLIGVAQGAVTRSFSYDLLSRLTMASNPETGPINYYYTTSGGSLCSGDPTAVCRRTDAKGVTTTYAYDTLNRLTSKTYSDSTHSVTYSYDGATCIGASPCYNKGRRTGMVDAGGSESWSYDKLGRESGDSRITNSITKQTTYTYNLDGSPATLTYPTGRMITYTPNAAGQPISSIDVANSVSYATNGSYAPNGALMTLSNSAQFNSTYIYNQRFQPCWMYTTVAPGSLAATSGCGGSATTGTIMDMKPTFNAGSSDNGNVTGITNNRDTTRSQGFAYDTLNRIYTAQTASTFATSPAHCWGEQFNYDQWANFLSIAVSSSSYNGCTQQTLSLVVNAHNQISSPSGYVYDADGNLTATPAPGAATFTYNAENQVTSTAAVNYIYDGDGKRVEKSPGKLYWYGGSGQVLDETDLSGNLTSEYIYFKGQRIARRDSPSNSIFFYFGDQLRTSREIVQSGQTTACYEADFYPFGGERIVTNTCPQNYKFTGKERDNESGNDYFRYRYYASTMGRWMSPDPSQLAHADPRNPQSLNLYSYVGNNPLSRVDLYGLCWQKIQRACDAVREFGESINNALSGYGFHTNDTVDKNVENTRQNLRALGVSTEGWTYKQILKAATKPEPNPYVTAGTDLGGLFAAVGDHAKLGIPIAAISLANDHSPQNIGLTVAGAVPELSFPTAFIGAEADLLNFEVQTVGEGMIEAAPGKTMDDGYGHTIPNPGMVDDQDFFK
jgi:RHS repeat-associated protein